VANVMTDPMESLLLKLLQRNGLLDAKKLEILREAQAKESGPIERLLLKKELASERDIAAAYAEHLALPLFEPAKSELKVDPALRRLLPEKLCRDQLIAPMAIRGQTLDLIFVTPNEMLIHR